ncbi:hypothetical protein SETIT_4G036100v2 [Setaria italica]|uniref:Uncharacterized protein n=1 Tax=Setaria italica TaxID=4555 RepID=A0A368QQF6_SETIT|nr:hypothetical protein SETIT_4G036100v2 [Setaria italica]
MIGYLDSILGLARGVQKVPQSVAPVVPGHWAYEPFLPLLLGPAVRIALRLSRGAGLAEVAFPDLNLVLLVLGLLWFHHSPPGSEARRWARFAIWVLSSSITVGVAWGLVGPPPFEAVIWGIAAAGVGGGLYLLVFY